MCAAAISFARIRRLYFGATDEKGGAVVSGVRFFASPTCHHVPEIYPGLAETRSAELLRSFFRERRGSTVAVATDQNGLRSSRLKPALLAGLALQAAFLRDLRPRRVHRPARRRRPAGSRAAARSEICASSSCPAGLLRALLELLAFAASVRQTLSLPASKFTPGFAVLLERSSSLRDDGHVRNDRRVVVRIVDIGVGVGAHAREPLLRRFRPVRIGRGGDALLRRRQSSRRPSPASPAPGAAYSRSAASVFGLNERMPLMSDISCALAVLSGAVGRRAHASRKPARRPRPALRRPASRACGRSNFLPSVPLDNPPLLPSPLQRGRQTALDASRNPATTWPPDGSTFVPQPAFQAMQAVQTPENAAFLSRFQGNQRRPSAASSRKAAASRAETSGIFRIGADIVGEAP